MSGGPFVGCTSDRLTVGCMSGGLIVGRTSGCLAIGRLSGRLTVEGCVREVLPLGASAAGRPLRCLSSRSTVGCMSR
eukprot:11184148-Lingulodinium_polyedra.AAC.1